MTALAIFATAVAAFLSGFLLGTKPPRCEKHIKRGAFLGEEETERLSREFSNFLA